MRRRREKEGKYLFGSSLKAGQKRPKIVRFRRMAENDNGEEVRETRRCRGVGDGGSTF
jgi:hypothetical protein